MIDEYSSVQEELSLFVANGAIDSIDVGMYMVSEVLAYFAKFGFLPIREPYPGNRPDLTYEELAERSWEELATAMSSPEHTVPFVAQSQRDLTSAPWLGGAHERGSKVHKRMIQVALVVLKKTGLLALGNSGDLYLTEREIQSGSDLVETFVAKTSSGSPGAKRPIDTFTVKHGVDSRGNRVASQDAIEPHQFFLWKLSEEHPNAKIDTWLKECWKGIRSQIEQRRLVVTDLGFAYFAGGAVTDHYIRTTEQGDVVKQMVYHGRTILNDELALSGETYKNEIVGRHLEFRIMALGKGSNPGLREGASGASFAESLYPGYFQYFRFYENRKRDSEAARSIDLRLYGDDVEAGLIRGCIITDSNNKVKACIVSGWLFEHDRSNYGEVLILHPESNLALSLNQRFDRWFEDSVPVGKKVVMWFCRRLGEQAWAELTSLLILILVLLLGDKDWKGDVLTAIIATLSILVVRVGQTIKHAWRMIR